MDEQMACGPEGCEVPAETGAEALPLAGVAQRIDVISDAICPWCWVGKANLDRALALLAQQGERFTVAWHPFQLNPDMPREGVERASYRAAKFGNEERGRQLDAQVAQAGAAAGVAFRHDLMQRTPNTVEAHRLIALAGARGVQHAMVEALFRAYFQQGLDIGSRAVLAEVAKEAALDPAEVREFLDSGDLDAEIRQQDFSFRQAGISGVPSFAMDGHLLFSGAMPAEQMASAFLRARGILRERAKAA